MKTKVLICGATGFIGRNLTEQLSKRPNLEVHAVRYQHAAYDCGSNVIWHQADFRKQDDVDRVIKGMHVVIQAAATIHSAKELVAKPYLHVTDNTIMNSYLFKSAFEHKIKHLIYLSSGDVTSAQTSRSTTDAHPVDVDGAISTPQNNGYTETKSHIENLCEFYATHSETKYTCIRSSNVYGPHDKFDLDRSHFLGSMITKAMLANGALTIKSPVSKQEYLFVDDLVNMIEAAIEKQTAQFRIYSCASGTPILTADLVKIIAEQTNKEITVENEISDSLTKTNANLNCTLAQSELGWQSKTDISTGIRKTVTWWKENVRMKQTEPA